MILNMIGQPDQPGATPKNEGQGFVTAKNIKLKYPENLAEADPDFGIVKEKKIAGHLPTATEVYGKKPDRGFNKKYPESTSMDEIMQKVNDPLILAEANELYRTGNQAAVRVVKERLRELAKGGNATAKSPKFKNVDKLLAIKSSLNQTGK